MYKNKLEKIIYDTSLFNDINRLYSFLGGFFDFCGNINKKNKKYYVTLKVHNKYNLIFYKIFFEVLKIGYIYYPSNVDYFEIKIIKTQDVLLFLKYIYPYLLNNKLKILIKQKILKDAILSCDHTCINFLYRFYGILHKKNVFYINNKGIFFIKLYHTDNEIINDIIKNISIVFMLNLTYYKQNEGYTLMIKNKINLISLLKILIKNINFNLSQLFLNLHIIYIFIKIQYSYLNYYPLYKSLYFKLYIRIKYKFLIF